MQTGLTLANYINTKVSLSQKTTTNRDFLFLQFIVYIYLYIYKTTKVRLFQIHRQQSVYLIYINVD